MHHTVWVIPYDSYGLNHYIPVGIDHTVNRCDSEQDHVIKHSDSIYPRPILGTDCNGVQVSNIFILKWPFNISLHPNRPNILPRIRSEFTLESHPNHYNWRRLSLLIMNKDRILSKSEIPSTWVREIVLRLSSDEKILKIAGHIKSLALHKSVHMEMGRFNSQFLGIRQKSINWINVQPFLSPFNPFSLFQCVFA